ncbi:MAG TPA: transporter substrate-binding domain-containing protein, partial [bacterium]|nr:transporter substrate-binding domain-containing protein [bacterium]
MSMLKNILVFCLLHILSISALADRSMDQLELVTLQLRWFHQFQFAGYYAAKEKGFYAEEGLNVEFRVLDTSKDHIQSVLDGDADYGVADFGLLVERMRGKPVVLLKQIYQHSPLILMTLKESGITRPHELKDKRVMLDKDSHAVAPILAMFIDTLGGPKNIKFVQHTFTSEDLINGSVDAISGYITDQPFALEQQGIAVNVINPRDYGIDFYGDNLFTTEQEIQQHPDRVEKIIRATIKGWQYALNHPEEIIDHILLKYNPALNRQQLEYEARAIKQMILPDEVPLGSIAPRRFKDIARLHQSTGVELKPERLENYIYQQPLIFNNLKAVNLEFTDAERKWLEQHPSITLGFNADMQPLLIQDKSGELSGIFPDIIAELESLTGLDINIEVGPWNNIISKARQGEVDGLLSSIPALAEEFGLVPTLRYGTSLPVVFAKSERSFNINRLEDIKDKRIAYMRSIRIYEHYLAEMDGEISLVEADSFLDAVTLMLQGKADVVLGMSHDTYHLHKNILTGVESIFIDTSREFDHGPAVRSDWPELVSILNKAITALGETNINKIVSTWTQTDLSQQFILTDTDKAWIKQHPSLRVGINPSWEPFEYFDVDGNYAGVSSDILRIIAENTLLRFEAQPTLSRHEMIRKARKGEIDIVSAIDKNEERADFLLFTKPYLKLPMVIVTKEDAPVIEGIEDLQGKTIAVVEGNLIQDYLKQDYPDQSLIAFITFEQALQAIAQGKADATIE